MTSDSQLYLIVFDPSASRALQVAGAGQYFKTTIAHYFQVTRYAYSNTDIACCIDIILCGSYIDGYIRVNYFNGHDIRKVYFKISGSRLLGESSNSTRDHQSSSENDFFHFLIF